MVWKKDLAKLKSEMKDEPDPPPKAPVPKKIMKVGPPPDLENEDALFLAAMGHRPKMESRTLSTELTTEPTTKVEPEDLLATPGDDFLGAMTSLKGLRPIPIETISEVNAASSSVIPPPSQNEPVSSISPATQSDMTEPMEIVIPEVPHEGPAKPAPTLIQLAAGMAIEVDGSLDLKGHSRVDALERLKERVMDGVALGWRTVHVVLGPSEELRLAFNDFLSSPEAQPLVRYAQAPIPMGGTQAWILYYRGSSH